MAQYTEQDVQLQFLEEAQEYFTQIESGFLGLSTRGVDPQGFNAVLRAAHSIKGGAAMMGFAQLSQLAHRFEDFCKVLKTGKTETDADLERLLLDGVDCMRYVADFNRQSKPVEESWLDLNVAPLYDELHARLGDPQADDAVALLSDEVGEDMNILLFESEVESSLQRMEEVLDSSEQLCLVEEFLVTAQELEGLGQMLDMQAFVSLCQSITQHLEAVRHSDRLPAIAQLALQAWRKSQSMVLIGQIALIPSQLDLSNPTLSADANAGLERTAPEEAISSDSQELILQENEETLDLDLEALALELTETIDAQPKIDSSLSKDSQELFSVLEAAISETQAAATVRPKVAPSELANDAAIASSKKSKISAVAPVTTAIPSAATVENSENTIRVSVGQINQLNELFGEMTIERNDLELQVKRMRGLFGLLTQRVKTLEQSNTQLRSAYDRVATQAIAPQGTNGTAQTSNAKSANLSSLEPSQSFNGISTVDHDFDILEMDRYSELHLLSQALMESAVQIQEVTTDISTNLEEAEQSTRELSRTSKLIQVGMMQIRMRPISDIVGRFPRMLRDLSLQSGKEVEFKLVGGTTLIERSILEALSDPLIHLIRNAFDHGIEDPATRQEAGKAAKGTIELKAAYRGNQTVITIRDDGRGISFDKIKAKALKMGLDATDLENAAPKDLLDLIFEPGFSTAEQVTDLSGRGVGMDIVRTNLQQVRGNVYIETEAGLGTTYTLTVPMTLSVVRVLLAECDKMLLAFPTDAIEEMVLLKPEMVYRQDNQSVFDWEGFTVPILRLEQWLKFPRAPRTMDTDAVPIIDHASVFLVAQGDELVGIHVDRYWGEQEVSIRQVDGTLKLPAGFAGCTILGDSRIAPLVDTSELLMWIEQRRQSGVDSHSVHLAIPADTTATQENLVMVVDDSVNVRRFLALTLEKAGYRVEQAKDGQHALEKVQMGLPIQAIICDVEMPRLDGYGFLANFKAIPSARSVPVVMLTSRSGDKHRKLAMSLGASDYFSKPFREHELLEKLSQLITKTA
jgi:two-component system, chemotaxis family, sensor histidine kinase and response regulator PixL